MSRGRSPGVPGLLPAEYAANETTQKPPRVLPTAMAKGFVFIRDGRVWIGARLGESKFMEISFSRAEFLALKPDLRTVFEALKEMP